MQRTDNSYKRIIKSTGIFGGSQIITILIGIVRNKLIAILLGTSGSGLISIYQSVLDVIKSISGFGIETSGVRDIAQSTQEEDKSELYKTIKTIDTWSVILALLGSIICIVCAYPVSIWLFNDSSHTLQIAVLSVPLFFMVLAAGQTVVLQGLHQISYMVKSAIIWNFAGLIVAVPLYAYLKLDGIIPVFIVVGIGMYYSAYYYRRKLGIPQIKISFDEVRKRGMGMLKLGFFVALAAIPTTASLFIIRAFLVNNSGLEFVGLFQAASTITNVYLSLILKSMGADFYPRLCGVIKDKSASSELINEQTHIVLILCIPAILALLLFSKLFLVILYTYDFMGASGVLNWQILGTYLKVLAWPLGFILLAKGKGSIFFITEMLYLIVYLGSAYLLHPFFGFESIGIAYLIGYAVYLPVVFLTGRKLISFGWTKENLLYGLLNLLIIIAAFYTIQYQNSYKLVIVVPLLIFSIIISAIKFNRILPFRSLPGLLKKGKDN